MSRSSLESKKAIISEDSRHRLNNNRSTTLELIPTLNYFTHKRRQKEDEHSGSKGQSIEHSLSSVSDKIRTLESKSKEAMASDKLKMSAGEFMRTARDEDSDSMSGSMSDSAPSDFADGEAEYVDSFTHYLFLKTDISLGRISRKLIQQLNDINLNLDDTEVNEEIHNHRINKRERWV